MHGFNFLFASVDCVMPASESVLVNGVSTIKLVPNDLSDDDDEPIQPFQLQRASTPASCLKLVHADTKATKDECPSAVCKMKRQKRWTW